jgi:hypothetical protein
MGWGREALLALHFPWRDGVPEQFIELAFCLLVRPTTGRGGLPGHMYADFKRVHLSIGIGDEFHMARLAVIRLI